eukprot:Tamp_17154.p1 GENE.Tamp_17154~~Tamp_17154.p1  ORF type:complete len:379 (-),score=38.46 Tamp_17154:275-1375(-)
MQPHAAGAGATAAGGERPPHFLAALSLDRRLAAASALEGGASSLRPAPNSTGYRADLLQEPEKKQDTTVSDVGKRLFAGGIAGAIAKTAIAPLDRTKIIFQTHPSKKFSFRNVARELAGIYNREGFTGLWRGNAATVVRVFPYAGIQFAAFDVYKRLLGNASPVQKLLAGSAAGATAVVITYPLDLIRARLAVSMTGRRLSAAAWTNAITGGTGHFNVMELYRGLTPTLIGILPYAGIAFLIRDCLNQFAATHYQTSALGTPLGAKMASGAIAGLIAQSSTYPLDLVRRRMQTEGFVLSQGRQGVGLQGAATEYCSIGGTFRIIWRQEGLPGLFKGLSMNWIKGPIAFMLSFSVFDYIKLHFALER